MITTNEAQNILIHDCADFGIQTFPTWNVPEGRTISGDLLGIMLHLGESMCSGCQRNSEPETTG